MGSREVRIGQLIAPFGPGSLYTDRKGTPHVLCGLDHWFKRPDQTRGLIDCEQPTEFEIFEPRLSDLLGVGRFRRPPDYRNYRRGQRPPQNFGVPIPALRFPCWYRHSKTGLLRRFNLDTVRLAPAEGGRWLPVRFVAMCSAGHLTEFPWKRWIGCECAGEDALYISDRGGSDLGTITVQCKTCLPGSRGCKGRSLSGTTVKPVGSEPTEFKRAGIECPGERPWLGEGAAQAGCTQPLVGALINQTNLYFPRTISAIFVPGSNVDSSWASLRNDIEQDPGCGVSKTSWRLGGDEREDLIDKWVKRFGKRGIQVERDSVEQALRSLFEPGTVVLGSGLVPEDPESPLMQFRREEFNALRQPLNDPVNSPFLRITASEVPGDLAPWIDRVMLVERVRETRVFFGFDRLEQPAISLKDMPGSALNQLFRSPPAEPQDWWLPAVSVFGEGLYLELDEERIRNWQAAETEWLAERLPEAFIARLRKISQALPPESAASRDWASRYLLLHTLAHIIINQLVFECGYSTAALRERLYVSIDRQAPMAGILIYTAAGDSEGTLGGLVRLGRKERLGPVLLRALARASWCSADPICSENMGGQGAQKANLAACHACVLLPETSCETINHGLDRAMIVGTPDQREPGWMAALLDSAYSVTDPAATL